MLVPIRMGTNMAAGNQQKHLLLSFATRAGIYLSRNYKTLKQYFFSYKDCSGSQIPRIGPEIIHFFNQLGSHANAGSRKSLEIQA